MEEKTIWCLFSVANDYDQPEHNLVAFWFSKPDIKKIAQAMNCIETATEDYTGYREPRSIAVLLDDQVVRHNNADYSLDEIKEGVLP